VSTRTANQPRRDEIDRRYDELYALYGKPLEAEHWGAFVAISPRGETLLGQTLVEVVQGAAAKFGPGNFIYKVGERAAGRLR
jgi:hypothetical protein